LQNRRSLQLFLAFSFAVTSLPAVAQVAIATVPAGVLDFGLAVNPVTNKIYVANYCGNDPTCASTGTVTVIDGGTLATQTVSVGVKPDYVAVNSVTNKIYVVNRCGNDLTCSSTGTVTVIDGATLSIQTISVGVYPYQLAVNSVTNKIYVANCNDLGCDVLGTVTVIDGATLSTQTVTVGYAPWGVAVNPVTNKVYVANACGNDPYCSSNGTVTVIDGVTLSTQTVIMDFEPFDVGINTVTNKIYVDNFCGTDWTCTIGTVLAIDGATLSTQRIVVGTFPYDVQVNSATNQTYVANACGNDPNCASKGTVTVIDGTTLSTSTVAVGASPIAEAVDAATNKIYVANWCGQDPTCTSSGTVTAIDGATNSTTPVAVGDNPSRLAANAITDRIYVPNSNDGTASVIAGDTGLQFVPVTPCRLYDSRPQYGGGGPIQGGTFQTFNLPQMAQSKGCADLSSAAAYSLNFAVVPQGPLGYLTAWPTPEQRPIVSTLNSLDGRIKANAAIVQAGSLGAINVYATNTTNVIVDIDGYFAPASGSTLAFYPLTPPCRVADTRRSDFPPGLGTPHLSGGAQRDFPVLSSACGIPGTAQAYSLNLTAVPYPPGSGSPLGYLEVWPKDQKPPHPVSTLNNLTGTIVANAALVPAGTGGEITVYPSNDTDLVIDVNGYFAPAGAGGLSLYPAVPCRVIDTRHVGSGQPFMGTLNPPVDVTGSFCGPPAAAQAYVFNATVVPTGVLGYLTLWPDGTGRPTVSTLNALDGSITNNMAIVPSSNGKVDAYASGLTQLILDISSYFAP
jgi:YVTN family beta-propeller protein